MTQINELSIRVPGMDHEDGRSLGNKVAKRVAAALPEGIRDYQVPELKIRMTADGSKGTTAMADAIAEQIIRQIKLATL